MSSVVDHIVILKLKDELESGMMESMILNVNSLSTIPGVKLVSTGTNMMDDGSTAAICVQLDSKNALKVYQDHSHHIHVRDSFIKPVVSAPPIAIDWESSVNAPTDKSTTSSTYMVNHLMTGKLSSIQDDTLRDISNFLDDVQLIKDNDNTTFTVGQVFVEDWMSDRTDGYNLSIRVGTASKKEMQEWIDSSSYTSLCDMVQKLCTDPLLKMTWESNN